MQYRCFLPLTLFLAVVLWSTDVGRAQTTTDTSMASTLAQHAALDELCSIGRVRLGIYGGYTRANLYGDELDFMFASQEASWLPSFHAGLCVYSELQELFWLRHELFVNGRGALVQLRDSVQGLYSSALTSYYLDFAPISLTLHISGLQAYLGPYISALLTATLQRKKSDGSIVLDESIFGDASNNESESRYLQKLDAGFYAGIEYAFPFGLTLGVRYIHGLIDIVQFANSYTLNHPKDDAIRIYNHAVMASIGYRF
ncbi:MAG: outer membrane beta-barrel protein [Bacteroidota bacterium]|nr:PorT family protein [Candidatus Kapabacteria bacterium]MDW8219853.1 outer membrane beta-barrel protein [Bacteroidota bacterium]